MWAITEITIWAKAPKVIYWTGNSWSREPVAAIRFATREEAERNAYFVYGFRPHNVHITTL